MTITYVIVKLMQLRHALTREPSLTFREPILTFTIFQGMLSCHITVLAIAKYMQWNTI